MRRSLDAWKRRGGGRRGPAAAALCVLFLLNASPAAASDDPLYEITRAASPKAAPKPASRKPVAGKTTSKFAASKPAVRKTASPKPKSEANPDIDQVITEASFSPSGHYGVRLSDLRQTGGEAPPAGVRQATSEVTLASEEAKPLAASAASEKKSGPDDIPLPEPRKEDGGLVFVSGAPVNIVGFYGYGGPDEGASYGFTGYGYSALYGRSAMIPVALSVAGVAADYRQSIYSAEVRAEAPLRLGAGELYPFAGYRTVLLQASDDREIATFGGSAETDYERRAIVQVPVGVGYRIRRSGAGRSSYYMNSTVGGILNMGDVTAANGAEAGDSAVLTGVGSIGVGVERGPWNFEVGADVGVASAGDTETGISLRARRSF